MNMGPVIVIGVIAFWLAIWVAIEIWTGNTDTASEPTVLRCTQIDATHYRCEKEDDQ